MSSVLIDTHAHLNFRDYQNDLEEVINRAVKNGVTKIICVSSNVGESEKAIVIAKKYSGNVYAAVGIHPHQTNPENTTPPEEQIKTLSQLAQDKRVVAIGECGLDYSPAPPGEKDRIKKEQFFLFKKQIEIAQRQKLSIIIHSREAFSDAIQIIKDSGKGLQGVFHCYSAGKKGIEKVDQLGFYFGVAGNLTYDVGLQNVFAQIPLEKILLETDCPFLSPEPKRGGRNEPASVKIIAEFLAEVKKVSFGKIAQTTTQNAKSLLKI